MQKNNNGSKLLNLTPSLSNSSLTCKYQFLEASDKPYIQVFNFQTSFSSNSGGGIKYTTLPTSLPCKKADFISMEFACFSVGCHDQKNKLRLSLVQVGESLFLKNLPQSLKLLIRL